MNIKQATTSIVVMTSTFFSIYAHSEGTQHTKSVTDQLYLDSFTMPMHLSTSHGSNAQSCHKDDTAVITIYSTNGKAQTEIDIKLDGSPVGSLTTYFPDNGPSCKSPSTKGILTLMVPAGKHTLEADSPNVTWPSHNFSIDQCTCLLLPLS